MAKPDSAWRTDMANFTAQLAIQILLIQRQQNVRIVTNYRIHTGVTWGSNVLTVIKLLPGKRSLSTTMKPDSHYKGSTRVLSASNVMRGQPKN